MEGPYGLTPLEAMSIPGHPPAAVGPPARPDPTGPAAGRWQGAPVSPAAAADRRLTAMSTGTPVPLPAPRLPDILVVASGERPGPGG